MEQKDVQTIQATAQNLKGWLLVAFTTFFIGLIMMVNAATYGGLVTVAGLVWIFVVKFLMWWRHA